MRRKEVTVLAVIVLMYIVLESAGVTCPIKFVTGVSCAGCGMSRAWLALLRGDWAAAFGYHPLVWLPVPLGLLLVLQRRIPRKVFDAGMWVCGGLLLGVYLVRLTLPGDVVVFAPQEGAVWRLVTGLF